MVKHCGDCKHIQGAKKKGCYSFFCPIIQYFVDCRSLAIINEKVGCKNFLEVEA